MSGALIQLAAKGAQDVYLTNEGGMSLFSIKYNRHTNFAQIPKYLGEIDNTTCSVVLPKFGDIVNGIWFEGTNLYSAFEDATIDFYLGGNFVDSHPIDFLTDIWPTYMCDSVSSRNSVNSKCIPLRYFFCMKNLFFPLAALQYHQIEVRVSFKKQDVKKIKAYANYIFLDGQERKRFTSQKLDFVITQTQKIEKDIQVGLVDIDLSEFKHPVKSLIFGPSIAFDTCDIQMNGTTVIEDMSPQYFHTVQNYLRSTHGCSDFSVKTNTPKNTKYYAYHFCLNASKYEPTGTCNFSKINKANLILRNVRTESKKCIVYAINYNILRIENGMAGILFGK